MPDGEEGWFVLNAKESRWLDGKLGKYTGWEAANFRFRSSASPQRARAGRAEAQPSTGLTYPAEPTAQKHGAAVAETTTQPAEAYKHVAFRKCAYEEGWLP